MTHDELDAKVRSLYNVGGIYQDVAECVEHYERPRCEGEPTGTLAPWLMPQPEPERR